MDDFEKYLLTESEHWKVFLWQNQVYLGRSFVWAKRMGVIDFLEITGPERDGFFSTSRLVKKAMIELFHPDLFNYVSLGNIANHLHIHIIPRYEGTREFDGLTFIDNKWGQNYAPYNYEFKIPDKTLFKIRDIMRQKLK